VCPVQLIACFSSGCVLCPGTVSSFLASHDNLTSEESLIVDALLAVLESRMSSPDDVTALRVLMREIFPSNVRLRTSQSHVPGKQIATSSMLNEAVISQLHASCLQPAASFVKKVSVPLINAHFKNKNLAG